LPDDKLAKGLDELADEEDIEVDEDLQEYAEDQELEPEYQLDPEEQKMLDSNERKVMENKIKAVINSERYKREAEKNRKTGYDFHGLYSAVIAGVLMMNGFLYSGVFITLYIVGLVYIAAKNIRFIPDKNGKFAKLVTNHPTYYLLAGLTVFLLFIGAGHQIPEIEGFIRATITSVGA